MSLYLHCQDIEFELEEEEKIIAWLQNISEREGSSIEHVNYIFCSDEFLLQINQKYLQHDYYTDIITFPFNYDPIEADMYISIDRIKDNALKEGEAFKNELCRVMVHGLLHMLGYKDKTSADQKQMRQMEDSWLNMLSS